ncbi:hypothetical protein D7322_18940 [Sphingobacterium puteale]|uniref:Uncharacterized protein n=1 Tax=Sphingobacterium puteale TaxID=2420510 RepID=A0A420VUD2_9SPHI|nr:hypothetical protein [Sphingobacterium puteale]RKO69951.1 hypothetical protein D7322_18940 [Sphingobacterium puteale]
MTDFFEKTGNFGLNKIKRRNLLPWWMKLFCWVVTVNAFFLILLMLLSLVQGEAVILGVYQLRFEIVNFKSPVVVLGNLSMLFKVVVAYMFWFEKGRAISYGKIDVLISIIFYSILIVDCLINSGVIRIPLEGLLLIPYYFWLHKNEYPWINQEQEYIV